MGIRRQIDPSIVQWEAFLFIAIVSLTTCTGDNNPRIRTLWPSGRDLASRPWSLMKCNLPMTTHVWRANAKTWFYLARLQTVYWKFEENTNKIVQCGADKMKVHLWARDDHRALARYIILEPAALQCDVTSCTWLLGAKSFCYHKSDPASLQATDLPKLTLVVLFVSNTSRISFLWVQPTQVHSMQQSWYQIVHSPGGITGDPRKIKRLRLLLCAKEVLVNILKIPSIK
jgi:hypothetical protein